MTIIRKTASVLATAATALALSAANAEAEVAGAGAEVPVYHLTPLGGGRQDGSDWGNAFSAEQFQEALNTLPKPSVLRVLVGDYPLSAELVVGAGSSISIVGGFIGSGETRGEGQTVIYRDAAAGDLRLVKVESASPLYWKPFVYARTKDGRRELIAHVVNCPPDKIIYEKQADVKPVTDLAVTAPEQDGKAPTEAWAMLPGDEPVAVKLALKGRTTRVPKLEEACCVLFRY